MTLGNTATSLSFSRLKLAHISRQQFLISIVQLQLWHFRSWPWCAIILLLQSLLNVECVPTKTLEFWTLDFQHVKCSASGHEMWLLPNFCNPDCLTLSLQKCLKSKFKTNRKFHFVKYFKMNSTMWKYCWWDINGYSGPRGCPPVSSGEKNSYAGRFKGKTWQAIIISLERLINVYLEKKIWVAVFFNSQKKIEKKWPQKWPCIIQSGKWINRVSKFGGFL